MWIFSRVVRLKVYTKFSALFVYGTWVPDTKGSPDGTAVLAKKKIAEVKQCGGTDMNFLRYNSNQIIS